VSDESKGNPGPIAILCKEIGFRFDCGLEREDVLVAFVRALVMNVEEMRGIQSAIAHVTNKPPSDASGKVLAATHAMLSGTTNEALKAGAAKVHDLAWSLNPEDAYPTDHLIDMLSSCASAIRFGLEIPCHSRHAAEAAHHVWGHRYGISLFDEFTSEWRHDWARAQLVAAITSMLPVPAAIRHADPDLAARLDAALSGRG